MPISWVQRRWLDEYHASRQKAQEERDVQQMIMEGYSETDIHAMIKAARTFGVTIPDLLTAAQTLANTGKVDRGQEAAGCTRICKHKRERMINEMENCGIISEHDALELINQTQETGGAKADPIG